MIGKARICMRGLWGGVSYLGQVNLLGCNQIQGRVAGCELLIISSNAIWSTQKGPTITKLIDMITLLQ